MRSIWHVGALHESKREWKRTLRDRCTKLYTFKRLMGFSARLVPRVTVARESGRSCRSSFFYFVCLLSKALQDKYTQRQTSTNQCDTPWQDTGRSQGHLSSYMPFLLWQTGYFGGFSKATHGISRYLNLNSVHVAQSGTPFTWPCHISGLSSWSIQCTTASLSKFYGRVLSRIYAA
jgi:hypothetical protein